MIPLRPCPDCSYPAAYDAFGNTDHVCMTGPRAEAIDELMRALAPRQDKQRIVIIESTASGMGGSFYDAWQKGGDWSWIGHTRPGI